MPVRISCAGSNQRTIGIRASGPRLPRSHNGYSDGVAAATRRAIGTAVSWWPDVGGA